MYSNNGVITTKVLNYNRATTYVSAYMPTKIYMISLSACTSLSLLYIEIK